MIRVSDIMAKDAEVIFDHFRDFTQMITISTNSQNTITVHGSLQSDLINFSANAGVQSPLCAYSTKLYLQTPIDLTITVGGMLTVDGVVYKVVDKREELGVLELNLSRAGRW